MAKKGKANEKAWAEARRRHGLSQAHVRMAGELGLNPKKLGRIDNHEKAPWKAPLPDYIEHLYRRRFRKRASQGRTTGQGNEHGREAGVAFAELPFGDWGEVPEVPTNEG